MGWSTWLWSQGLDVQIPTVPPRTWGMGQMRSPGMCMADGLPAMCVALSKLPTLHIIIRCNPVSSAVLKVKGKGSP